MWYPVVYLVTTIFPLIHRFVCKCRLKPVWIWTISQLLEFSWEWKFMDQLFNLFSDAYIVKFQWQLSQSPGGRLRSECWPIVFRSLRDFWQFFFSWLADCCTSIRCLAACCLFRGRLLDVVRPTSTAVGPLPLSRFLQHHFLVTRSSDLMSAHDPRLWVTLWRNTCAVGFL